MMADNLTIKSAREALDRGDISPEELFKHYQDKIKESNPELNAYLSVFDCPDHSLLTTHYSLSGIPCAIKDNMLVEGTRTTAASKILENYIAPFHPSFNKKKNFLSP